MPIAVYGGSWSDAPLYARFIGKDWNLIRRRTRSLGLRIARSPMQRMNRCRE